MASLTQPIELDRIELHTLSLDVEGITPLITHRWSEKAKKEMRDKQAGVTKKKKEPKDPQAEYESAFYRLPDGEAGMPATAFKAATVGGARNFESVSMVQVKQGIFVIGIGPEQLVEIVGEPEFTEMPVRIAMGTADLRYRPLFWPWTAHLDIQYNPVVLSANSVVALVDAGGIGGVGEWRPSAPKSHTGSYGMYRVVNA